MTDEELGQCIVRYRDRLALRAFCRQRAVINEKSSGAETMKCAPVQKLDTGKGKLLPTEAQKTTELAINMQAKLPGWLKWDGFCLGDGKL